MKSSFRACAAICLFCALSGCAKQELLWYGHDAERSLRLEIRKRGKGQWISAGKRESRPFEEISIDSFTLADRGPHFAFAAMRRDVRNAERWYAVLDLVPGPAWDGVAELTFAPRGRRFAYAAERRGKWRVLIDGRPSAPFASLQPASLQFSANGERAGYVVVEPSCERAVVDDRSSACHADVIALAVASSPDRDAVLAADYEPNGTFAYRLYIGGRQIARFERASALYVADNGRWAVEASSASERWLVVDGEAGPRVDAIGDVVWAPGGGRLAYTARRGDYWVMLESDGHAPSAPYRAIEAPEFSRDGRRLGFVARTTTESHIVVDGRLLFRAQAAATALRFAPSGDRVAWIYRAGRAQVIAVGDRRHTFEVVVDGSMSFSSDGSHWAALVGSRSTRELYIVVDGRQKLAFDADELFGNGVPSGDIQAFLRRWVSVELERFLKGEASS